MLPKLNLRTSRLICALTVTMAMAAGITAAGPSSAKKSAAPARKLTPADVQKIWKSKDDTFVEDQIKRKGLTFEPEEEWLFGQLPKETAVALSDMPKSTTLLKSLMAKDAPVDTVAAAAPALLNQIKAAAQKRSSSDLESLLHPELFRDKGKVYDLFDVANYRGHSLGLYAPEPNRRVSVQFFQLNNAGVERVHYVYFSLVKNKVVMREIRSGPEEAERFLHDEEKLAQNKLETMFRALNDGDDSGIRTICSDGLYEAVKKWGGDKHPGDRLTRGHNLAQVTVTTSVPLDQKSVRVVARISYPLTASKTLAFDADFERIGSDLRIVRVRDVDNKVVIFDPNIDNYLNRRYGIPDAPPLQDLAMTEKEEFLGKEELHNIALHALQDHNSQRINEIAQAMVEADPRSGLGYGLRAGADQLLGKYDEAERDFHRALELSGTVYYLVERHSAMQGMPFSPVVLGISKTKIEYIPTTGFGTPEEIPTSSIIDDKIDVNHKGGVLNFLKNDRPFLSLVFTGADGKKKTYNFASFGTQCQAGPNLTQVPGGGVCGSVQDGNGRNIVIFSSNAQVLPLFVPTNWQRDLSTVLRTIDLVRGGGK